jgi:NTP pyrophosphatase (non-canonical NTP hydrolase)
MEDVQQFWNEQAEWSQATFGTDTERGPLGPAKHLRKEIDEVLEHLQAINDYGTDNSDDERLLEEYADCLFLLFDSARRARFTLTQLIAKAFWKLAKNKTRIWVRNPNPDEPTEHTRGVND